MTNAAIYCRLSREDPQDKRGSADTITSQIERNQVYAKLRELEIVAVLDQDLDVSASIPLAERPGGGQLVKLIASGKVNVVIATKLPRLWRDVDDGRATAKLWRKRGVALHFSDMGGQAFDTSSAMGWTLFNFWLVLTESERLITGERTKQKLTWKRANGHKLGGLTPFGYLAVDNGRRGKNADGSERVLYDLKPDDQEQLVIAQIVGQRTDGDTLQKIGDDLMQQGIKTKCGTSVWTPRNVKAVIDRYNKEHTTKKELAV